MIPARGPQTKKKYIDVATSKILENHAIASWAKYLSLDTLA